MEGLSMPCWYPIRIWKKSFFPFIKMKRLNPEEAGSDLGLESFHGLRIFSRMFPLH